MEARREVDELRATVRERDETIRELRELKDELEDELEVLHEAAAGGGSSERVAQLEDEIDRLEDELQGGGGGAGEAARLRREKRQWEGERRQLEEQLDSAGGRGAVPTGTGGGSDAARAAELEEKLRSLKLFGALNVVGAAMPEPGDGFDRAGGGMSEAEREEMEREKEELEEIT